MAAHLPMLVIRLSNAPHVPWTALRPLAAFVPAILISAVWLRALRYRGDPALPGLAMLLIGLGIAVQFRIGRFGVGDGAPTWFLPAAGVLAIPITVSACRILGSERLRALWMLAWVAALAVLVLMQVFGRRYRGGLYLPGLITPTEIIKPLLAVALAGFLAGHAKTLRRGFWPGWSPALTLGILWGPVMVLLFVQRDLGMLVLLNAMLVLTLYAVSRHRGQLAVVSMASIAAVLLLVRVSPHAQARVQVWMNPFADPTGRGWQVLQSLAAMYTGGWWGEGLGAGSPTSVPIVASDFVYAAWAEETGFVGCVLLVAILAALVARAWTAAGQARSDFSRALGAALATLLGMQTLLNLGGVTKALPLTGIPLPFISHGGSSLLALSVCVGLMATVSESAHGAVRSRRKRAS